MTSVLNRYFCVLYWWFGHFNKHQELLFCFYFFTRQGLKKFNSFFLARVERKIRTLTGTSGTRKCMPQFRFGMCFWDGIKESGTEGRSTNPTTWRFSCWQFWSCWSAPHRVSQPSQLFICLCDLFIYLKKRTKLISLCLLRYIHITVMNCVPDAEMEVKFWFCLFSSVHPQVLHLHWWKW